ncbi:MAG: phage tail protein I [Synergistaceae bacterium]|nr:phage tail protein I [Synergistaceae bacterium]
MAKQLEVISLQDIIPASIAEDKNIRAIRRAIDPQLQEVSQSIREAFIVSRINELLENVIDLLAWQWHVDFYEPELPIETKRALVLDSISWHRKKGTKAAIISALRKLNFEPTIKEWFEPELQTEPHTFSVRGYYKDDHVNVDFLGEDTEGILTRIIELTKPARSHMIKLTVAPIPIDMTKHICRWDFCNWEHVEFKRYDWGLLIPDNPFFEDEAPMHSLIERGILTLSDVQYWDAGRWGYSPYRLQIVSRAFETGIFAELEDDIGTWMTPSVWNGFSWDEAHKFYRPVGAMSLRTFPADFALEDSAAILGAIPFIGIIYDSRPYWDMHSWEEHSTWAEEVEQEDIGSAVKRDFPASLKWGSYPPSPRWSSHKTWEGSDTWENTTEQAGTWEVGTWEYQEVV